MNIGIISAAYIAAAVLFILSLGGLSGQESAKRAVWYGIAGMGLAVLATVLSPDVANVAIIGAMVVIGAIAGWFVAKRVQMTEMPQLVAALHSFVGLAAVFIGFNADLEMTRVLSIDLAARDNLIGFAKKLAQKDAVEQAILHVEVFLGVFIGAVTFTGSIVAFGKLAGKIDGGANKLPGGHILNATAAILSVVLGVIYFNGGGVEPLLLMTLLAFFIGYHLIMGIGGADMPVVVSMLNSYSGWAAAAIGFTLGNDLLIVTGALVGSSGAILSYIMCKAMNRSIISVMLGGFGAETSVDISNGAEKSYKSGSTDDVSYLMSNAESIIIVPGYGLAVARAQHALQELTSKLIDRGVKVRYAIHPVAGRMPGHMNVLLAEADVPYDQVVEMDDINSEFSQTDVVLVVGANDVVNPAAKTPGSAIYGMPILEAQKAKMIIVNKRSMAPGYAGLDNELFYLDKTMMLFGDAKKVVEDLVKSIE